MKTQECIPVGCVPPIHYHMGGLPDRDSLDRDPLDRDLPGQRSPGQRPPWTETSWTETPPSLDRDPLDGDPQTDTSMDRDSPCHVMGQRPPPPVNRMTHISFTGGNKCLFLILIFY